MTFVDVTGTAPSTELDWWEPVVIRRAELERQVAELLDRPAPPSGRREALIVHPRATAPGMGLAPGIRVTLSALKPGERTVPLRHNSTQVGFCLAGSGKVVIGGQRFDVGRYDVWNHPSWTTWWCENDGDEPLVRLTYSNAALLEQLAVHLVEERPPEEPAVPPPAEAAEDDPARHNPFGTFALADGRAYLMPYETLINPPSVPSLPLHWPWAEVKRHLDQLVALGDSYRGRRLYLLYNQATGRTNGTTPGFFATMTIRPPGIVDRPHRHVSAAINYYFHGSGRSVVAGKKYEWEAGDLMLSAPGWAVHHHASGPDEHVYELTVQDQPFNIAMESLLWQEDLRLPARVLGAEPGFVTNRERG